MHTERVKFENGQKIVLMKKIREICVLLSMIP